MNLEQPTCDTSLLGVAQGAMARYGLDATPHESFVLSGHAFVINIHEELCPSGPYCWNSQPVFALLGNLGLRVEEIGMLSPAASSEAERAELEAAVRAALGEGAVCSLLGLDHQLILGQDEKGFVMAQPWGSSVESTPARLSFGTWREYRAGPPVAFYKLTASGEPRRAETAALAAALDFALDVWRRPGEYAWERYGMGDAAYANWLAAIDGGRADEHGNWWNAVVWGECRERAGDYFQRLAAAEFPGPVDREAARGLARQYRALAKLLYRASDKSAPAEEKRRFVSEARAADADCIARLGALRAA